MKIDSTFRMAMKVLGSKLTLFHLETLKAKLAAVDGTHCFSQGWVKDNLSKNNLQ